MARHLAIIILLAFIFSACSPASAPAPAAAVLAQPTLTLSQPPVPTESATPALTPTPDALLTLALDVTQPPTLTPSPVPTRTATLNPTFALAPKLPFHVDCDEKYRSYSPDEEWVALVCLTDRGYAITSVYSLDGLHVWQLHPSPAEINARPVEFTYLMPFHWIVTGRYLYLAGNTCCREVKAKWYSGYSLARLDLVSGEYKTLITGLPGYNAFHFGFSEGEGFLMVFDMTNPWRLRFINLFDGTEQNLRMPQEVRFVGNEIWAPHGYEMALEACSSNDVYNVTCDTYSIYLFNFNEPHIDEVLVDTRTLPQANGEQKPVEIGKIEWEDGYHLRLYDANSDQQWVISVVVIWPTPTDEVWKPTEVTPTP